MSKFFELGYDFGDISQKSLKEIWSSPKMTRFRTLRERNDICLTCSDLKNCFGGCRAMSYAVFNDPEKLHPLCNKIYKNIGSEGEIFACWEK